MSKQKIVVVDDDFYLLDALNIQLTAEQYEVTALENGLNAFETIKSVQPDCVVLDVMMPGKTGLELTRELKDDEDTKLIPIILLTAKSELDDKVSGFDSGAEDYITKPFDFRELNARIKSQIRLYKSIKKAYESRYALQGNLASDQKLKLISWDNAVHSILFTSTKTLQGKRCLDIFKCHLVDCPMKLKGTESDSQELTINPSGLNEVKILKECRIEGIAGNQITITDHRTTRQIIDQLVSINEKLLEDATRTTRKNNENVWYLSNLNHELKGPLSAIIGYADMASKKKDSKETRKYLDIIDKSARNIMMMMTEMIDLANIESGKVTLNRELISFSDLVDNVIAIQEFQIEQKRLTIESNFDKRLDLIKVDPNRFKQLILNVVSNAVKYNKVDGHVKVSSEIQGDNYVISIKDTGIGIAEENIPMLLGDDDSLDFMKKMPSEGFGFGLKLTKMLVELHKGTIKVESQPDVGTTVSMAFPYDEFKG